jgi:hypothetical protein
LETQYRALLALSSACDLAVLLAVLYVPRLRAIGLGRVSRALASAAAVALLKLPMLCGTAQSLFFAVALGYVDLVVVTPLAAPIALALARHRPITTVVRRAAWAAVAVLPAVGIYATFVEPNQLVVERCDVRVAADRAPSEPLRIAVLADIQSREVDAHLRAAVRVAMAFEPHLIVLPGDLISVESMEAFRAVVPQFRELLQPLSAPLGVYFSLGNTDTQQLVADVFQGTRVRMLVDEQVEVQFGGRAVVIGGAGLRVRRQATQDFVARFEQRAGDELRILVAHYPDVVLDLHHPPRVDLFIAGHTHGGQVRLPFFGPPITLSRVPRHVAAGGLHELNGRMLYVSRGIGAERGPAPQLRFNCAPEVSLLTILPAAR